MLTNTKSSVDRKGYTCFSNIVILPSMLLSRIGSCECCWQSLSEYFSHIYSFYSRSRAGSQRGGALHIVRFRNKSVVLFHSKMPTGFKLFVVYQNDSCKRLNWHSARRNSNILLASTELDAFDPDFTRRIDLGSSEWFNFVVQSKSTIVLRTRRLHGNPYHTAPYYRIIVILSLWKISFLQATAVSRYWPYSAAFKAILAR